MNKKGNKKSKKKYQPVIMTNASTKTRIIIRKNNPSQNKTKLEFKKYCPIQRKRLLFKETKNERHLK